MNTSVLVVVATQLQMLVALHMLSQKDYYHCECLLDNVDLVVLDNASFYYEGMKESLLEIGVFNAVYTLKLDKVPAIKIKPTLRDLLWKITKRFDKYYENGIDSTFIQKEYGSIFCFDERMLIRLKRSNKLKGCTVYCYDEGTASYIRTCIEQRNKVAHYKGLYSYNPELVERVEGIEIYPIVNKMGKDLSFLHWANQIFGYTRSDILKPGDIIFFDQPVVNANLKAWVETLLKRIGEEHKIYVKPHPRSSARDIARYTQLGNNVSLFPVDNVPWELVLLNNPVDSLRFITISSTAALAHSLYIESSQEYQSIFLYALYNKLHPNSKIYEVNKDIEKVLERFNNHIPGMYIPQSEEEVLELLSQ